MAFAIASGVKPEAGLFTAIIAGFLISALGGSSVQIGGPAGAFIVIVYGIVERYGLANLLIATALAGVLLFVLGLLKLGALVRYVPVPIVIGFTNGIAVLIALSQVKDLLGLTIDKMPADFFTQIGVMAGHLDGINPVALALGLALPGGGGAVAEVVRRRQGAHAAARAGCAAWPRTCRAPSSRWSAPRCWWRGCSCRSRPSARASAASRRRCRRSRCPSFSWASAKLLLIPTITIALLGAIESLLCARVADNLTDHPRHDPNQELMAQGVANFVVPFFGGIPATGTIARTVTNVRAGAASPIAGIVHALTLLAVVLLAAPLAVHVPLAALAGILLFVAWNMGEWHEFVRLRKFSAQYRTILLGTFVLTVVFDLTVAVQVGLVLACVFFIYRMSTLFSVRPHSADRLPRGVQVFELFGALFFGAVGKIEALPAQLQGDTRAVVLDMHRLISIDTSGLEALQQLHRVLKRRDIGLVLANVNEQPLSLIRRSGFEAVIGADAIVPGLDQALGRVG